MIPEFVIEQRDRFTNDHNNAFAFSWAKVTRRLAFLDIIQARYEQVGAAFIANSTASRKLVKPGTQPVTPDMMALHHEGARLGTELHLEIESFYLFAKIVLDDIARAIEFYFGSASGLALDSHDDLSKRMEKYAAAKGLAVTAELVAAIVNLRERVSDFRDQKISHEKSPRTMQGTSWKGEGSPTIMMTRIFPRETDPQQAESEPLGDLRTAIDRYIQGVISFINANADKTRLKLEKAAGDKPA